MAWLPLVALLLAWGICQGGAQNVTSIIPQCQSGALAQHNYLRSMHQAPALVWNDTLATAAQAWAQQLASSGCSLAMESNLTGGENTWSMTSDSHSSPPCDLATLGWYSQGVTWRFTSSNTPINDNVPLMGTAYPFIYAVWSDIQQLGCGAAQGQNGCWAVVCRYPAAILAPQLTNEVEAAYLTNIKAPVAPASLSSTADQQQCQQDALAKLDGYRADHGVPALTWNASMAEHSLVLAAGAASNKCNTSWLRPSPGIDAFHVPGSDVNGICGQAMDSFYSTGSLQFTFTSTPWTDNKASYSQWSPYTQMIWKNTTEVGCGSAQGTDGCWVMVCKYNPPGNVQVDSAFLQNVLPAVASNEPNGGSSNSSSNSSSGKKTTTIIIAASVAAGVLIAVLAGFLFWFHRRGQQNQRRKSSSSAWWQAGSAASALSPLVNHDTNTGHTGGSAARSDNSSMKYLAFTVADSTSGGVHIMSIPGLMTGEPFTRGTAFEYSWIKKHSSTPVIAQAVESGVNDLQLDAMVQSSSGQVQDCPVVCLSKEQVKEQLQLLTDGLRGRGGAALVFKALWPCRFGPDALLAVKVIKDGYDCNPYVLQSFAHEASVLASVRHPNVVKLYGYCLDPPNVCIIMELLPCSLKEVLYGRKNATTNISDTDMSSVASPLPSADSPSDQLSIQSSYKEGVPLTMSQVLQVSTEIAAGLAYLHDQPEQVATTQVGKGLSTLGGLASNGPSDVEQGTGSLQKIVHRDLKPANILINSHGQIKITDFGLARRHDSTTIDTRHVGAGTLPYQAPEILSGSRAGALGIKATNRCDVYSMAMIFWELLSRQPPWKDTNEVGILSQVLNGKRPALPAGEHTTQHGDESSLDLTQLPASLTALPAYNDIIRQCWAQRDLRRPTAVETHRLLLELQQQYKVKDNC